MVIIDRTEIVGRAKSKTALVDALSRYNTLNHTAQVDFNKYGEKDGVGFQSVTEKFVDNFILSVLVPEYNTKNGSNVFVGSQNRTIRELLRFNGLENCKVKAIGFSRIANPSVELINVMPNRNANADCKTYFIQQFKIACPNIDYSKAFNFIRNEKYKALGFFLKDFDVTLDYSGSFNKNEVIDYLVGTKNFKVEGGNDFASRVIVDNNKMVGQNCLTYMETVDGITTRQKIYNKMVQMLECKSVRSSVGCHWKDWVCQENTRLATARDKSTERGLTRAEVTFYVKDGKIPTEEEIESVLFKIVEYIPKELVFSTPYSAVWKSYCESFKHSLVCIDRYQNIGVVVYSYNELTENISGFYHENWSEKEKWCLEKLTLNGNLPLDVIDIATISKTIQSGVNGSKRKLSEIIEITGSRYFKVNPNKSSRFTTRLVSKNGCYSFNVGTIELNSTLLNKAGFGEHVNCLPFLAKSKANGNNKTGATLERVDILEVKLGGRIRNRITKDSLKQRVLEEAQKIEEIRRPLLAKLSKAEESLKLIKSYTEKFTTTRTLHLRNMDFGGYQVEAARKQNTKYGASYRLLVNVGDDLAVVWANSYINEILFNLSEDSQNVALDKKSGFLLFYNKPLAVLTITGRGINLHGHTTVYCTFKVEIEEQASLSLIKYQTEQQILNWKEEIAKTENSSGEIQILPIENLIPYKECRNLIVLPLESVHRLDSIGYVIHYGVKKMVVKLSGSFYQAGEDLQRKELELTDNCYIKIIRIRTNKISRIKFAECKIYTTQNYWTAFVNYAKVPIFSKFDGQTCIVDVKYMEHKNLKRKILLTDQGEVFKLKKSKLEDNIEPGYY